MPVIDMHAHVSPDRYKEAIERDGTWHGLGPVAGELDRAGYFNRSIAERLEDMDRDGIDAQLVTPTAGFYQYENDLEKTVTIARDCNDAVAELVDQHPGRFHGLGTLPMQDVPSAVEELERVMGELGMKGVMVSDHVAGKTYDEPEFMPFFQAAERLGAIVFFHQGGDTCVGFRTSRYKLSNAVGNLTERTLTYSALVFGGVLDRCPDLKLLLAHGGGYTAYGVARLDKVAGALEGGDPAGGLTPPFGRGKDDLYELSQPPSSYLDRFYYDCCTYSEPALRFLVDAVGIDRVVLGTDYPAPMTLQDSVNWVRGMTSLTDAEKDAILSGNATALLGL